MHDPLDLWTARLALERGLVTQEQLAGALAEQAADPRGASLGEILGRRGWIGPADLEGLLAERKKRIGEAFELSDSKLEEALLGRLLVRQGLITERQLYECLGDQAALAEQGKPAPRLGELLARKKYLAGALPGPAAEEQVGLFCARCGARYRTSGYDPEGKYSCRKCRGPLLPGGESETTGLLPVSRAPLPEDVVEALKDPSNRYADGRYLRVREVGRGGMGVVWKAWQTDLERYVAIKQMTPALWSETEQKRFLREAQTAARLSHPNIATVYDTGVHEGKSWIAMEFIEGDPLSTFTTSVPGAVTRHGPPERRSSKLLPLRHALEVLKEAAEAVEFAHQKGVIHRDLKPHNLMLSRGGGRVYVMDFGLARPVQTRDGITLGDSILGTPPYMSPEQARGDALDRRTDVYSLGAVLYFLLAGRPPFQGNSPAETLMLVLAEDPEPPRTLNPGVPPDLEKICLKALSKDRHRRYESAKAFAEDLGRFLKGEPVRARRSSARERLRKWVREHPARSAALAAASVVAIAALSIGLAVRAADRGEAAARVREGDEAARAENWPRALAAYEAALALDGSHAAADAGRRRAEQALKEGRAAGPEIRREADRAWDLGRWATALALYERALRWKADPAVEERIRRARAELQREEQARAEADRTAKDAATAARNRQEREEARKAATPHLLAAVEAIEAVDRMQRRESGPADLLAQLAYAETAAGRAVGADSTYLEARLVRAKLRHRLGDHAGAIEDYSAALEMAPWSRQAAYGKCYTTLVRLVLRREAPFLRDSEDLQPLEAEFHAAVEEAAQEYSSDAYERWAVMALQELVARATSKAAEKMRTIALEGRAQPAYHFLLAYVALEEGGEPESRAAKAVEHLGALLELDPLNAEGLHLRSVLRARTGDAKGALEDAERAVPLRPGAPGPLLARAQALKLRGRYDAALKDLEKAVEIEPKLASALKREIAELQRLK